LRFAVDFVSLPTKVLRMEKFEKLIAFFVFVVGFLGAGIPLLVIGQNRIRYLDDLAASLPFYQTPNCNLMSSLWLGEFNDESSSSKANDDRCYDRYEYTVAVPDQGVLNITSLEGPRTESDASDSPVCEGSGSSNACERCPDRQVAPLAIGAVTCWISTAAMTDDAAEAFECATTTCSKLNDPKEALDRLYPYAHNFRTGGIVGTSIGSLSAVSLVVMHLMTNGCPCPDAF